MKIILWLLSTLILLPVLGLTLCVPILNVYVLKWLSEI